MSVKLAELYYAGYFYFVPMLCIAFVSLFGNRSLDTDIKAIGVPGIAEIDIKDFEGNKAFFSFYNSVNKI